MKRWMKVVLVGFLIGGLTVAGVSAWQDHQNHRQVLAAEQADAATITALKSQFPLGTALADVRVGLHASYAVASDFDNQILLLQGTQPSGVWYCGPHTRYVVLKFSLGADGIARLEGISREARGLSCL